MTCKPLLVTSAFSVFLAFLPIARAQTANACDLNHDEAVDILDIDLAIKMALGSVPCTATVAGAGVCNVVVVQRVTNAALGQGCLTGTPHSVSLSWTASVSQNLAGYNVYRGSTSNGPYTKVNSLPMSGTAYTDSTVQSGHTYYYVATAVDSGGDESVYSNQAQAVVPSP